MSHLANLALGLAWTVANLMGSQLRVSIDGEELGVAFVRPGPREEWYWEPSYSNGVIHYEDYATPIKVPEPNEGDVITTNEYETFMQQDVIREAFHTEGVEDTPWILIGVLIAAAMSTVATLLMLGGGV